MAHINIHDLHCRSNLRTEAKRARKIVKTCTIKRSREELFRFWRDLENLPRFSKHLLSVRKINDQESHWVVKSPAGTTSEWDAIITNEHENHLIAWESIKGSEIDNAGSVRFEPAPGEQGTEVRVTLAYIPPIGKLGAMVARLYGEEPDIQVEEDLGRFKALMEAGEIPTTEGQPTGGKKRKRSEE
jgi:uncharacterized membrane protein